MLLVLICVITLFLAVPQLVSNLRDIGSVALENQSSISATKKQGESAIYRSVDVPHGLPLTSGLRLQAGYKLRDGILRDIWYYALKKNTVVRLGEVTRSIRQINSMIHLVARRLDRLGVSGRVGLDCESDDANGLLVLFACFFVSDRTVVVGHGAPDLAILFTRNPAKNQDKSLKVVDLADPDFFDHNVAESSSFDYDPLKDHTRFNNQPYSEFSNGVEYRYFQRSFVSSVASQLMSLSTQFSWTPKDRLWIVAGNRNNALVKLLCGIMTGVESVTLSRSLTIESLVESKTTILSAPDNSFKSLIDYKPSFVKSLILGRAEFLNAQGIFNSWGKAWPLSLRLVYIQDFNHTSIQLNKLKSILGSRIIKETDIPGSLGPILKSNLFEYRLTNLNQLGVASNSVELKSKNGQLYARGFILSKYDNIQVDEEMWLNTKVGGFFATDGCFYKR